MTDGGSAGMGHGREEVEKLLTQAETGGGRTAARPSAAMGLGGGGSAAAPPACLARSPTMQARAAA